MRGLRKNGIVPLTLAMLALSAAPLAADPMVAYGESIVPRDSFDRRRAEPVDPAVTDELLNVVSLLNVRDAEERRALQAELSEGTGRPFIQLAGQNAEMIQVYIFLYDNSEENVETLRLAGAEIEVVSSSRPLVQAMVPMDILTSLGELPFVRQITLPSYGVPTAGEVESQGWIAQATALIYTSRRNPAGSRVDGTGTVLGVISNGLFPNQSSVANCNGASFHAQTQGLPDGWKSDLPIGKTFGTCLNVPAQGYYGDVPIAPAFGLSHVMPSGATFPEGRAMLEVMHDVAPGASLIYATATTSAELEARREYMMNGAYTNPTPANRNPRGLDVIADNFFFYGEGRYDGSSAISRDALIITRLHNLPYLVTAGGVTTPALGGSTTAGRFPMQINGFFNGDPRDTRAKVHSWSEGQSSQRDEALSIRPDSQGRISISLVWDDVWDDSRPRSMIDLNMYLVPRETLSIAQAVAASVRPQNGNGDNPVERLIYFGSPSENLALVMVNKNNTQNIKPLFTLVIERGVIDESNYLTHGVALNNSDALKPVISVAEIDMTSSDRLDPLSATVMPGKVPGGTKTQSFIRWYEDQVFPTVVDYSSVNTRTTRSLNNNFGFTGPSAAMAHTAGLIGLLRHRFPEMPPTRLWELFQDDSALSSSGEVIAPLATNITPAKTLPYHRAPVYRRVNHFALYNALNEGHISAFPITGASTPVLVAKAENVDASAGAALSSDWSSDWEQSTDRTEYEFDLPEYRASELGLELKPGSPFSYGYWASPVLKIEGPDGEVRSELRTDRVYVVEARVGTTATDSTKVPDFRLRLTSGKGDESASLLVAGVTPGGESAPSNIGGNTYHVYYRPSNAEVAKQGVKFYFELVNFNANDDVDASVILRDFILREMPLPAEQQ